MNIACMVCWYFAVFTSIVLTLEKGNGWSSNEINLKSWLYITKLSYIVACWSGEEALDRASIDYTGEVNNYKLIVELIVVHVLHLSRAWTGWCFDWCFTFYLKHVYKMPDVFCGMNFYHSYYSRVTSRLYIIISIDWSLPHLLAYLNMSATIKLADQASVWLPIKEDFNHELYSVNEPSIDIEDVCICDLIANGYWLLV